MPTERPSAAPLATTDSTTSPARPAKPNPASPHLRDLVESALDRRGFLHVSIAGSCAALMSGVRPTAAEAPRRPTVPSGELFTFANIPPSQSDEVVVPEGYVAQVLYRWGDPINGIAPKFRPDATNSADDQNRQAGMGHDGMEFFPLPGADPNRRGLLAINHEYTDQILLFPDGIDPPPPAKMPLEKVRKSQASHGVSIVEIARADDGSWQVVDSPKARRITADTPMRISGPATTKLGTDVRGTCNNCASGRTPWGTYLTCEENFQGVFGTDADDFKPTESQKRYGLTPPGFYYEIDGEKRSAFRWWQQQSRFDLANPDNDSVRYGFVVEIDPQRPDSTAVKRTALGRFRHENAELVVAPDGRVVVYMGDDEMNEFLYKFVSAKPWQAYAVSGTSPQTSGLGVTGSSPLDEGTLYVAKFDADGSGRWIPLVPGQNGIPAKRSPEDAEGFDAADICIRTREAATAAGATPMDRPEWVAAHPHTREVFVSLTNNKKRESADAANPRVQNVMGHIVRWIESENDPTAETFTWKIFLLAGNPQHAEATMHGNVAGDTFGCPDGLKFDASGILWIQTDMSSSVMGKPGFEELGNNMMLAADPDSGQVRRFLTGPVGCEITGMTLTPDRKTMFINIQHPGEPSDEISDPRTPMKYSQWPDGPDGIRPRAATVAIRRRDGGIIGS